MIKKCQGCGAILQDKDPESLGYVPNLSKNICLRCFKMQNYGYKTLTNLNFTNESIITKINKVFPMKPLLILRVLKIQKS